MGFTLMVVTFVAIVVIALVALALMWHRAGRENERRRALAARRPRPSTPTPTRTPIQAPAPAPTPPASRSADSESGGGPDTQQAMTARLRAVERQRTEHEPESDETLGADFYVDVSKLLCRELEKHPHRFDLRFKLLEVYSSSGQKEAFLRQTREYLQELGGRLDTYWPRIVRMGRELVPESGLYTDMPPLAQSVREHEVRESQTRHGRRYYDGVGQMQLRRLQAELQAAYQNLREDREFWAEVQSVVDDQLAPPAPLSDAPVLSQFLGGAAVSFCDGRDRPASDAAALNAIGQVVIAKRMGKSRVTAGGREGLHAVAVARAAARVGLGCTVYLHRDEQRDFELRELDRLRAELVTVRDGVLSKAAETQLQALSDSIEDLEQGLYICPLSAGPTPYPTIIHDLQGLAGRDLRAQLLHHFGRLPDALMVSSEDGMHAVGLLHPFLTTTVSLYCVESAADQQRGSRERLAREHSWLRASERVRYQSVAADVARFVAAQCAPESLFNLHLAGGEVLAEAIRVARGMSPEQILVAIIPRDARVSEYAQAARQSA